MFIHKIAVKNFRLLVDIDLALEKNETVIVGRNNSGKTSLAEVIRRFVAEKDAKFKIEDFSNASYDSFFVALEKFNGNAKDDEIRSHIPSIELRIWFEYDLSQSEVGSLSDFIIDLDAECNHALVVARYELADGKIEALFADQHNVDLSEETRLKFFQHLRERVPALYTTNVWAEDPNDASNRRKMTEKSLQSVLKTGFVNAQRGLSDETSKEQDILSKILMGLYEAAESSNANEDDKKIARALQDAVEDIQKTIEGDFKKELRNLIPTLKSFGYPGLGGSPLETETFLDVKRLLSNHTKIGYASSHGVLLPESYNGLGMRNLIFILLRILSFHRVYRSSNHYPCAQLVFIEEPEAHLHPQMQEVFIKQISKLSKMMSQRDGETSRWPVQFIISTHSSHIANAARFDTIRYFLSVNANDHQETKIKDFSGWKTNICDESMSFLHRYLNLISCDLFFADKAILVEGASERLLLPAIIEKLGDDGSDELKLSHQYITVLEVGGAYAHLFFELLDFLELRTLIITDLDSVDGERSACSVQDGISTSNASIKSWFREESISIEDLLKNDERAKTINQRRIAYQLPESDDGPCGRTLEDAFIFANPDVFEIENDTKEEQISSAERILRKQKKTEFALKYAVDKTDWKVPRYIAEGLRWLAAGNTPDDVVRVSIEADNRSPQDEAQGE